MGAMKPEQQRIAIAEACGWTTLPMPAGCPDAWEHKDTGDTAINEMYLPDYLSDLNAMHEAEVSLSRWQKVEYCKKLSLVILSDAEGKGTSTHQLVMATAAQRAEAFLKTLDLWEGNDEL